MLRPLSTLIAASAAAGVLAWCPSPVQADGITLKWATEGYLRTRSVLLTNLAPQDRRTISVGGEEISAPDIRNTSYLTSRLRLMPTLRIGTAAALHFQIDALDDVLWGDNNGLSSAPLFATDGSNQPFLGGEVEDSVKIRRAWLDFDVGLGRMRVGRMPSHWGMGLLANGGGTGNIDPTTPPGAPPRPAFDHFFDDDFGDNHFGSTADRVLFVTKPLAVARGIGGEDNPQSNLIVGYAYDVLSEAPFYAGEPLERTFRPFGQQGFISRGDSDDAREHVVLMLYNNPDWDPVSYTDELRVGFYGVARTQTEGSTAPSRLDPSQVCGLFDDEPVPCEDTGSLVWIADLWWKLRYGPWYTEGELIKIGGTTFGGVPYPGPNLKKEANITGGVVRFGYLTRRWDAVLELGHASGDNELEDQNFKQRALHPDYNVGLILFEETLRELSARTYGFQLIPAAPPEGATGFFSNGGVINANYVYPHGRLRPMQGVELTGAVLMAWVDELADTGIAMFFSDRTDSSYLGTEVDLAIKARFHRHMTFSLETGYLRFGGALKSALPNADGSFSLQSRVAFVW